MMNKVKRFLHREWRYFLWSMACYYPLLPTFMFHNIRPYLWRKIGIKMGKNVGIGYGVYVDVDGYDLIEIGDDVLLAAQTLLLTHRRDMKFYSKYKLQRELPYIHASIKIENNVSIGMRSVIMPGVTIGEGSVIGANSTVTKNIPPHSIAVGNPAKVIKEIQP